MNLNDLQTVEMKKKSSLREKIERKKYIRTCEHTHTHVHIQYMYVFVLHTPLTGKRKRDCFDILNINVNLHYRVLCYETLIPLSFSISLSLLLQLRFHPRCQFSVMLAGNPHCEFQTISRPKNKKNRDIVYLHTLTEKESGSERERPKGKKLWQIHLMIIRCIVWTSGTY